MFIFVVIQCNTVVLQGVIGMEVKAEPSKAGARPVRTLRASDAEWQIIKKFADFVKLHGAAKAEEIIKVL